MRMHDNISLRFNKKFDLIIGKPTEFQKLDLKKFILNNKEKII